jgi:hypothetical protein
MMTNGADIAKYKKNGALEDILQDWKHASLHFVGKRMHSVLQKSKTIHLDDEH